MVSLAMILHDHGSLGKILARSCQDLGKHTHASWQACQDSCHWATSEANAHPFLQAALKRKDYYLLLFLFTGAGDEDDGAVQAGEGAAVEAAPLRLRAAGTQVCAGDGR